MTGELAAPLLITLVALRDARWLFDAGAGASFGGDWQAHVFRIRDLARHGLAPWTHDWGGGLPLWSSYQFLPHAATRLATTLTGASDERAMAAAQGTLLALVPLTIYLLLRASGLRLLPALAGALLAIVLDGRDQPITTFSELWGLTLAPLLLWACYRSAGRRSGYAVAALVGAAAYVHPLATALGSIAIVAATVVTAPRHRPRHALTPPGSRFQAWRAARAPVSTSVSSSGAGEDVPRRAHGRPWVTRLRIVVEWTKWMGREALSLLLQLGIVGGVSAWYWWPALDSARPVYEDAYFSSPEFERLLAHLATRSFAGGWPLWLGLSALAALALALSGAAPALRGARNLGWLALDGMRTVALRTAWLTRFVSREAAEWSRAAWRWMPPRPVPAPPPPHEPGRHPHALPSSLDTLTLREWQRAAWYLLVIAASIGTLALTAAAGWGPRLYLNAQLPRLLSVLPLLAAAAIALTADAACEWAALAAPAHQPSQTQPSEDTHAALARAVERSRPAIGGTRANAYIYLLRAGTTLRGAMHRLPRAGAPPMLALHILILLGIALLIVGTSPHHGAEATALIPSPTSGPLDLPPTFGGREGGPPLSFARWLAAQPPTIAPPGSRVATPPEVVAVASAQAYGRAWYTSSYSGRDWSILAGPLALFMTGFGAADTRAAYLTAMAVDIAVVPAGARPEILHPLTGAPASWQVVAQLDGLDVLRLPWRAPYAVTVLRGAELGLEVPDAPFTTVEESYVRDELTRRWAALLLSDQARPAIARPRSGTVVDFELRSLPPERVLLVSETWDRAWRAESGGRRLPVSRAGPNLLAVDLAGAPSPVLGDVHVRLIHDLPREWWRGGGIVAVALLVAVLVACCGPERSRTPLR